MPEEKNKSAKKRGPNGPRQQRRGREKRHYESYQSDLRLKDILIRGEKVIVSGEVHWGIYWKSGVLLGFGLLVMIFLIFEIGLILTIAGLIGISWSILMRHLLLLVLTNKRILFRYGILQVDVVDIHFKNIESVELERMLPGFLLGYSNVVVSGIGNRGVIIPYVSNGVEFRRKFNEMLVGDVDEEPFPDTDIDEELEKLHNSPDKRKSSEKTASETPETSK